MSWNFTFFITSLLFGLGLAIDGFLISLSSGLKNPCEKLKKICGFAIIFALFQFFATMLGWFCVGTISKYFSFIEDILSWIALVILSIIGIKMIAEGTKKSLKEKKQAFIENQNNENQNNENYNNKDKKLSKVEDSYTSIHISEEKTNLNKINIEKNKTPNKALLENKKEPFEKRVKSFIPVILIQGLITSVDALSVGFVISDYPLIMAITASLIISSITFFLYVIGFNIGKKCGVKLSNKASIFGGIVFILIGIEIFITTLLNL